MSKNTIKVIKRGSEIKIISSTAVTDNTKKIRRDFEHTTVRAVKTWIDERRENKLIEGSASRVSLSAWSPDQIGSNKLI